MIVDLNGPWNLCRDGSPERFEARVPGCVHADLLAAGAIPDPFVGENEDAVRWVYKERWNYRREFNLVEDVLARVRVLLCCAGLDTVARIILNGRLLGSTDNYKYGVLSGCFVRCSATERSEVTLAAP